MNANEKQKDELENERCHLHSFCLFKRKERVSPALCEHKFSWVDKYKFTELYVA
jgi:hypothetical protein